MAHFLYYKIFIYLILSSSNLSVLSRFNCRVTLLPLSIYGEGVGGCEVVCCRLTLKKHQCLEFRALKTYNLFNK